MVLENLSQFLEKAVKQHTDIFFALYSKNNQFAFINDAVEKILGWKPESICKEGFGFENLMTRPKSWKLIKNHLMMVKNHLMKRKFIMDKNHI